MNDAEYALSRIALVRPRAQFVAYSHSSEFIEPKAGLGDGFHHVNLYDTRIDANVIRTPRGVIVVQNTFLSSFAYNLFLCWIVGSRPLHPNATTFDLDRLLAHNFKKFFAEQLLNERNHLFSRAIFLETLLFEQVLMVPVFAEKAGHGDLAHMADFAASLMSSLLSFHELGHFMLARDPRLWEGLIAQHPGVIEPVFQFVADTYPPGFVEEFKCDVIAAISCIEQHESEAGSESCLRTIVFAFAAYSVLSSLAKSARRTMDDLRDVPDDVDFDSIEKHDRGYTFSIGMDLDLRERARLVAEVCRNIAARDGISLYGPEGDLPLPVSILDYLLGFVDRVMESDDANARAMSMLVAESMHGHPRGMDYLVLRSKTFDIGHGHVEAFAGQTRGTGSQLPDPTTARDGIA